MQLAESRHARVEGRTGRQVEQQRLHLGAQEVVGARRAERGESWRRFVAEEIEHDGCVGEAPDHRPVRRGEAPNDRGEPGRLGSAGVVTHRRVCRDHDPNGSVLP